MNFKKGLALFLCLAIFLSGGAGMAFASVKISAKLISMEGDVQVIRAGGEKPFKAFVNMRLTEGDRIITGSNGTAKVQMEDDVIITLAENTRIYLSELRGSQGAQQSSINLQSGAVGSSVGKKLTDNSRFEIKTPTAVMGVRGTEFFTQYYNGTVDVRVVNGTVEVSVSVTENGGVAGPGATAVQTYTFPVAALQQVNFGEQTPLSQLQQPPQPLGLIGLPLPFLDRVQEINQQIPGAIPQDVISTIDQAVQSAIQTTQDRMSDPNLSPSELESFIEGVIAGNLEASLPSFAPPGMEIPPLPPQLPPSFFPGGGGGDSGGDDGGTTPLPPQDPDPETFNIYGTLRESGSDQRIKGVSVELFYFEGEESISLSESILTDSNGQYTFMEIPIFQDKNYYIWHEKEGYVSLRGNFDITNLDNGGNYFPNSHLTRYGEWTMQLSVVDQDNIFVDNLSMNIYHNNYFQYIDQLGGFFEGENEENIYQIFHIPFSEDGPGDRNYKLVIFDTTMTSQGVWREFLITPDIFEIDNENKIVTMSEYTWPVDVRDIYGTISKFASGETINLEGVELLLYSDLENMCYPERNDLTDEEGHYYLSNIPVVPVKISIEKEGFLVNLIEIGISELPPINISLIPKEYADNLVINIEDYVEEFFIISADANRESDLEKEHNSIGITSPEEVLYQDFWVGFTFPSGVEVIVKDSTGTTKGDNDIVVLGDQIILRHLNTGLTRTYTIIEH